MTCCFQCELLTGVKVVPRIFLLFVVSLCLDRTCSKALCDSWGCCIGSNYCNSLFTAASQLVVLLLPLSGRARSDNKEEGE